jgi:hypothetical protein
VLKTKKSQYSVLDDGSFEISEYNHAKPFSNFLPGIAGPLGIPLWVFYVNRGQGIASFGVENKDHAYMEFFPANRSYEQTNHKGFRTFIKATTQKRTQFYEPFQKDLYQQQYDSTNQMRMDSTSFSLREQNMSLGLDVQVRYFGVANEPFAALAREVKITNTLAVASDVEVCDGLPLVVPFGLKEFFLKSMSRTVEAWMKAEINTSKRSLALYKLKSDPEDRPEFQSVDGAHFYIPFAHKVGNESEVIVPRIIADSDCIFSSGSDFSYPNSFISNNEFDPNGFQVLENKTPCAFSHLKTKLEPGESIVVQSYFGETKDVKALNKQLTKITTPKFFAKKYEEAQGVTHQIQNSMDTVSGNQGYDHYCRQTFLDNVLRGGYPYRFAAEKGNFIFHIYSRKHGDLERDYNQFVVQPTYFSQGEGNFRDVNQNRRNDVWFEPELADTNVKMFYNLIQTDGFNPLIVEQLKLNFKNPAKTAAKLSKVLAPNEVQGIQTIIGTPQTPGQIYQAIEDSPAASHVDAVLKVLFTDAERWETARHGEGFWSEHWTYNLDLLDSYLDVYPEKKDDALALDKTYTFYDNDHRVHARRDKYVQLKDGRIRQYGAVFLDREKEALIASRKSLGDKSRVKHGQGEIYTCTLLTKLVSIIANKYAALDPSGIGVEMESDKPDWYDAANGLPGLFGSSLSGTYELLRHIQFLITYFNETNLTADKQNVALPEELHLFIHCLHEISTKKHDVKPGDLGFWDESHNAKESYWQSTRLGYDGKEIDISFDALAEILVSFESKVEAGIRAAYKPQTELCPTYFMHAVDSFKTIKSEHADSVHEQTIVPESFKRRKVAPFLEGPMHAMRVEKDPIVRQHIYDQVRASELFDRKLGMYTVTGDLSKESPEIGRCHVFSPGWLENQSVFLHMEYKWLLELLKSGLYSEYLHDFETALVPFQDPSVYGRSVYENVSFIASSAFPNKKNHGTGFVARLSGSTAEFLDMWLKMNVGDKPYKVNASGELEFHLQPVLPLWIFTKTEIKKEFTLKSGEKINATIPQNGYAFVFMSQTLMVYHNTKQAATVGDGRSQIKQIRFLDKNKKKVIIQGHVLPAPHAQDLRSGAIRRIDVELG